MTPKEKQDLADRKALEKLASAESGDEWEAVETDEATPTDRQAQYRTVVRLLKANLAGQAVTARILLKHDQWLSRIGHGWSLVKRAWPAWVVIAARPEIAPQWLRGALASLLEVMGGQG